MVSVFSDLSNVKENLFLPSVFELIRNGSYRDEVLHLRKLIENGNKDEYDQQKKKLPSFTPCGTFKGSRTLDNLDEYSNCVHLDFDKLDHQVLESVYQKIVTEKTTIACFRSPGGNGLKVFTEVTTGPEHHSVAYRQVREHYEKVTGIQADPKCKDIPRLCFFSFDPDLYYNHEYKPFHVNIEMAVSAPTSAPPAAKAFHRSFEECIAFTEKLETYIDGNRNNFIFLLARNCKGAGIAEQETHDLISARYDLPKQEIRTIVRSSYRHNDLQTANFANFAVSELTNKQANCPPPTDQPDIPDHLSATPILPGELFDQLPGILRNGASVFAVSRERDVFLTAALSILSGCMPNVQGVYSQETVYPHLFCFVIAPAASGKGALKFAKMLANKYHDVTIRASREEQQRYTIEMEQYKMAQRSKKKNEPPDEMPEQPPYKVVYIPANTSYAKIISHLEQNDGQGIICETEADTMGNVFKQDWGGYSDMLRKAFHHESISSSRKANNEYVQVDAPRLAVALSGTPSQVTGLISSSEDGLFSRFIFYTFRVPQVWKDVSPDAGTLNLTEYFNGLSAEVFDMVEFLKTSPTEIKLSASQWQTLNTNFTGHLTETVLFTGGDAGSVVKRLGLILYRIAMILTTLRKFENGDYSTTLCCSDADFNTASTLVQTYLQHSILMFHNLPKQKESDVFRSGDNKRQFFEALPKDFARAEAIELGKTYKLSERSVGYFLKDLLGKYLTQPIYGSYSKII